MLLLSRETERVMDRVRVLKIKKHQQINQEKADENVADKINRKADCKERRQMHAFQRGRTCNLIIIGLVSVRLYTINPSPGNGFCDVCPQQGGDEMAPWDISSSTAHRAKKFQRLHLCFRGQTF